MAYESIYETVTDLYDAESKWEELVTLGDRESLNLGEEALGRHGGSEEMGLFLRDFETGATETYTWAELNAAANRVANYLEEHTARGARVGAMLPAQLELYAVIFGTLKAGRIYVPLAPAFGRDALNYRLADSGASILFTDEQHTDKVDTSSTELERVVLVSGDAAGSMGATTEPYTALDAYRNEFETVETHPTDLFAISYTSGTTGQPKGSVKSHKGPLKAYTYAKFGVGLRPDDRYFVAASPAWSYGLSMGTIVPGLFGTAIGCYRGKFDPVQFFETLEAFEVTNTMVPPTALRYASAADIDVSNYDIDLRVLITAGESLDEETVTWCEKHLKTKPQDAYGFTEGGMVIANYAFPDWEIKAGSMGKPVPGFEIELLDDDGNPVEQGEEGEICIKRGKDALGGYWGMPEKSLEKFHGRWLRSGDLARQDEDGYFWYVSRKDAVIISSGYRIGPDEVQETLLKHEAVRNAGVIGVPDETRGERVKAYVSLKENYEPNEATADDITAFARQTLSKHEYPREIEFLNALPKTASGKIKRAELEDLHSS